MNMEHHQYQDRRAVLACRKIAALLSLPREANYADLVAAVEKLIDKDLCETADKVAEENRARAELAMTAPTTEFVRRAVPMKKKA